MSIQTWSSLLTLREQYPGTRDISRKLGDDLRMGMGREGEGGKGEIRIEFPYLSCWLEERKMEAS